MKKVSAIALSTAMALSMALPSKVNATSRVDQLLSNMSTRQKDHTDAYGRLPLLG